MEKGDSGIKNSQWGVDHVIQRLEVLIYPSTILITISRVAYQCRTIYEPKVSYHALSRYGLRGAF